MNTGTQSPTDLMGYDVLDGRGNSVGTVSGVWVDADSQDLKFLGVQTGDGETHIVPISDAHLDDGSVTVPYSADTVAGAPSVDPSDALTREREDEIDTYFSSADMTALPGIRGNSRLERTTVPIASRPAFSSARAADSPGTSAPGTFPVDDLTYDLITLMHEKLVGLEAYDQYLDDAGDDGDVEAFLQQLREQDFQAVQGLRQLLATRLNS
jgi:sporulation protein YlmC with PRC-barrel domain